MPIAVTPTLSLSGGYEDDISTQVSLLIRYLIMNPGNTSDLWEANLLSLRFLVAKYGSDRRTMAIETTKGLRAVLSQKFKDCEFMVDVTDKDFGQPGDSRYRLSISVRFKRENDSDFNACLVTENISVDPVTYAITIKTKNDNWGESR